MLHYYKTAALPPPIILMASSPTPTTIILTWEQPEGADAVDSYEINYLFLIHQCDDEGVGNFPQAITVSVGNSSLRRYTLSNSASIPVEEDSLFQFSLTAVNSVTRSVPSQPVSITTAQTGMNCLVLLKLLAMVARKFDFISLYQHLG